MANAVELAHDLPINGSTGTFQSPNWVQQSPTTEAPYDFEASMAFDPLTNQIVLFGGGTSLGGFSNQTWIWMNGTWTLASPATAPPARAAAMMAWDPAIGKVVLFGGGTGSNPATFMNDAWGWDGTNWAALSPTGSLPAARGDAGMAWDPALGGLVLFGGLNSSAEYNDTWLLKNNAWSLVQAGGATGAPLYRDSMYMAYSDST